MDCIKYVQKCQQCQIYADMIRVPPNKLTATSSPCRLGMDFIGPIEPADSNGHRFILVAIDYSTKWVEVASNKAVRRYRNTVHTSTGETLYLLVYGTEAIIPAEVESLP
uniref:Uncharacterized protein LOC104219093 n=1 Tax=Nicotiana sylvestris TaxID=4096 RepID=A0A1U7VNR0_NICSY|nr:PREDICTED: uncharacterized protein LOC104219093 [Nicotiana sylvestris]